ncbi:MAG TPA: hypothetical protein VGJ70_14340, partial [Solirubrobacteraceae bacterium]
MGRWAPLVAAILGSAIFAGPAFGQAAVDVTYNTADILQAGTGGVGDAVTVDRGAHTGIANGTVDGINGEFGLNSAHNVLGGLPTGCWEGFTPQI